MSKSSHGGTPDGGSAFPEVFSTFHERNHPNPGYLTDVYSAGGMTLRDYFAANALQGILASEGFLNSTRFQGDVAAACDTAVYVADALLERLAK